MDVADLRVPSTRSAAEYFSAALRAPMLTPAQERELVSAWYDRGDRAAYEYLIFAHLRMMAPLCRTELRNRGEIEDFVQEVTLGIMVALEKFDPSLGFRVSTFALHYIKDRVWKTRHRHSALLTPPSSHGAKKFLVHRAHYLKRIAEAADPDREREDIGRQIGVSADGIRAFEAYVASLNITSLSAPAGRHEGEGDAEFGDFIADPTDVAAEAQDAMHRDTRMAQITAAAMKLDPRSRAILVARYFADSPEDVVTLEVLSERFNITRERVRQLEVRALQKVKAILRHEAARDREDAA